MSQMEGLTLALIIGGAIDAVLLVISVILAILLIVAKQREKMAKIRKDVIKIEVTGETDNEPIYDNEPMYENTVQISLDNDTSGEVGQSNRGSTESSDRPRVQPAGVPGHDTTQCQAYKPLEISSDGTEPVIEMVEMQPSEATEQPSGATEQPSGATEQPSEATEQSNGAAEQPSGATEQPSGTGYSVTQCRAYKLLDISSGTEPAVAVPEAQPSGTGYSVTQCKAYKLLDISSGTEPAVAVEDVEVDEEEYVVVTN